MKISEVIQTIKDHHYKQWGSQVITEETTRDRVLYGSELLDRECTGIVTTIYASVEVIKEAHRRGANLIVPHEALFWNHGDRTDWLQDNKTFQLKKQLLDETGIVVWRDHDHIHAGLDWDGRRVDGIFYGLAEELGWTQYLAEEGQFNTYVIPRTPTREVAQYLMEKMGLKCMKTMGNIDGYSEKIYLPFHIIGPADNSELAHIEENNIDTLMCAEITDFTVAIYMRDGAQLGLPKAVLVPGHFNIEEPGMQWFGEVYLPTILPDIPVSYVQAGDSYTMLLRK